MPKKGSYKKVIKNAAIVAAVLVAAGLIGFGVQLLVNRGNSGDQKAEERSLQDEIQDVRASGDFNETNSKIDKALGDPNTSSDDRYMLYVQQGSAFEDQQNLGGAAEAYKKAESIKQTYEVSRLLIMVYQAQGNKEEAINYCKKAITQLRQQNNPFYDEDKALLEQIITDMGGQV